MPKENEIRKKAIEVLEKDKWLIWYPPKIKFKQTDIFGIIDLLAIKGKKKKNIQLTTLPNISIRRKKIINFFKTFKVELPIEIWAWNKKKKEFKKEKLNNKIKIKAKIKKNAKK